MSSALGTTAVAGLGVAEPADGQVEAWLVDHAPGIIPAPNAVDSVYLYTLQPVVRVQGSQSHFAQVLGYHTSGQANKSFADQESKEGHQSKD